MMLTPSLHVERHFNSMKLLQPNNMLALEGTICGHVALTTMNVGESWLDLSGI